MKTLRQEIRFCNSVGGVRIPYAMSGNGPPLVKAPNWLTHLEFDWESPVWRHWMSELSRGRTLLRYDLRGCGLSDRDPADVSFEAIVADLEAVVVGAGLDRFPLFGMSNGGPIAIEYAVRHPEKVSCLVLYGAAARGRNQRGPAAKKEADTLLKLIELGWGTDNPAYRQVFTSQFIPGGSLEQFNWFNEIERVTASTECVLRLLPTLWSIDISESARRVSCPTLIMHAKGDAMVPFEQGRVLAGLIPGARFLPLEGRNHILLADEPAWREFLAAMRLFLTVHDGPAAPAWLDRTGAFTERERDVVELLAQGMKNEEIAVRLHLSEKTVRNHITAVFAKLDVSSRGHAIVRAREAGFGRSATGPVSGAGGDP